ncbi:MAG TPA: Gfo/Idh/MocA family oxidoreductase [Bryobacteraceae bacterium]|nr:Gfo/Idh/MocA family oxidoreductase [Bryobacteraceae bacterium]
MKRELKFVCIGAGFWSRYQLAGWNEVGDVQCVAIANRTRAKAETVASSFGIQRVYDDPSEMIAAESPDFVDIVTDADTHAGYVELAAQYKVNVVCQKPMAPCLATARRMVKTCNAAGVRLLVNENWRWQAPIRALKNVLDSGAIGEVFRARIEMISGFPVFRNQPFLKQLKQFILTDLGSHTLDTARFLFGEAASVYCQTNRVHSDIQGEDVASVLLRTQSGATVIVQMAYAGNFLERERFPETFIFIEGRTGTLELAADYWVRTTTAAGTHARRYAPPRYAWADPAYDLVHASIVPCQLDLAADLRLQKVAETTGEDNLQTMELVFASYESAESGQSVGLL